MWTGALQDMIRALKLAAHAGLGEIHEVSWIVQQAASRDCWTQPGVLPQAARLSKILVSVVGNIQVNFICQAHDLALTRGRVNVDKDQVYIGAAAQQVIISQQTPAQVCR